jgi:predicted PolB exonuclease-like 3'-5' exonuclease
MNLRPKPDRANVFLDVETTTLDNNNAKGALSALTGRIVCACTLRDDGTTLTEETFIGQDEAELLRGFWRSLKPTDTLVGHNALNFDLTFIRQRSWILEVRPSRRIDLRRFYTRDVVDTLQIFSNWGVTKYPGLNDLADALGVGQKIADGCQVGDWWTAGDLGSIAAYCRADVRLSYKVYNRLMFLSLPDRFTTLERSGINSEPVTV